MATCTRISNNTPSRRSMNTAAANLLEAFPYGLQAGNESSAGLSVSRVSPDPSEFMT